MKSKIYPLLAVLTFVLLCYGTFLDLGRGPSQATRSADKVDASPSPVTLRVLSSAIFKVGDTVTIDSTSADLREKETVTAIPDATHVTVAKLDRAHGAEDVFAIVDAIAFSKQLTSPAPTEQSMGNVQRIFYYHVPAATCAYSLFLVNFIASIIFLWKRSAKADLWAVTSAEVGLVFATVVLITGPIWGRSAWGIWWAWEPRLTTFLVLWLLYVSYLVLRRSAEGSGGAILSAVVAVFAFLAVPFSYMANRLRGHHPPPITLEDPGMKFVLMVNMLAFLLFAGLIVWFRSDLENVSRKIAAAHIHKATRSTITWAALPGVFLGVFQNEASQVPESTPYMVAGYISAWVIYLAYLVFLMTKLAKLKKEAAEVRM